MKLTEEDIRAHMADIDVAIRDLQSEKRALENLLVKFVVKEVAGEVAGKRSYIRIYNEEKIRQALSRNTTGLTFKALAQKLRRSGVLIKDPTLRSYLTRMSIKKEIIHNFQTKHWILVNQGVEADENEDDFE